LGGVLGLEELLEVGRVVVEGEDEVSLRILFYTLFKRIIKGFLI